MVCNASSTSTTGCGAKSSSSWVHRSLFWQLSIDGNSHGLRMSHATTASQKQPFRASLNVGNAVIDRENAGWTTSKSGHPCPRQNCLQGLPVDKDWKRISAESSLMSPTTTQSVKGLNLTELLWAVSYLTLGRAIARGWEENAAEWNKKTANRKADMLVVSKACLAIILT